MKHVLFDLKQCLITPPLDDEEYIKETLIEASKIAKLELLKVDTHKFQPYGVYKGFFANKNLTDPWDDHDD